MLKVALVILWSFLWGMATGQTISSISSSICDSLEKVNYESKEELMLEQLRIYHDEMVKYPTLVVDITGLNKPKEYNEFNYRINRDLMKNCALFRDQFSMLPLSKILDLEGLFNDAQYDSLERAIVDFISHTSIDLIIVSVDDPFPHEDLRDFTTKQRENWRIGRRYANGGILICISRSMNGIEFAVSEKLLGGFREKYLKASGSQKMPSFSRLLLMIQDLKS